MGSKTERISGNWAKHFSSAEVWGEWCGSCDLLSRHPKEFLSGSSLCCLSWWRHITVQTWVWSRICSTPSNERRKQTRSQVEQLHFTWIVAFLLDPCQRFKPLTSCTSPCPAESNDLPPQLPPRNFSPNDLKDGDQKSPESACKSLSDTYLMRLQHVDLSSYGHICKNLHWCSTASCNCPPPDNSSCNNLNNTRAVYCGYDVIIPTLMSSDLTRWCVWFSLSSKTMTR